MDADILVKKNDVEALIDAINHLKKYGTLALSYENNHCNPERNVLKAKAITGTNGKRCSPYIFLPSCRWHYGDPW